MLENARFSSARSVLGHPRPVRRTVGTGRGLANGRDGALLVQGRRGPRATEPSGRRVVRDAGALRCRRVVRLTAPSATLGRSGRRVVEVTTASRVVRDAGSLRRRCVVPVTARHRRRASRAPRSRRRAARVAAAPSASPRVALHRHRASRASPPPRVARPAVTPPRIAPPARHRRRASRVARPAVTPPR